MKDKPIKIWRFNQYDWIAGYDLESAKEWYAQEMHFLDEDVFDEYFRSHTLKDCIECYEHGKVTFQRMLEITGFAPPCIIASTEW